jgi:hypothetical protein
MSGRSVRFLAPTAAGDADGQNDDGKDDEDE